MSYWVYLNGQIVPYEKAVVPVEDRGYQFGDGVYEVLEFYGGEPYLLDRHLDRLERSARELEISLPSRIELQAIIHDLVRRNEVPDAGVYIQLTRGVAIRQHAYPEGMRPTLLILARPLPGATDEDRRKGVSVILHPDERWHRCDIKSLNLLGNVMARQKAIRTGAWEAILFRGDVVTEATSHNFFAVVDGVIRTHPADRHILSGIIRGRLIELVQDLGLPLREEPVRIGELPFVEEMFLTATGDHVVPVVGIDGKPVGDGRPGSITSRLCNAYLELLPNRGGAE